MLRLQQATIIALLEGAPGDALWLGREFVGLSPDNAGPLARLVGAKRTRALDLYLLARAIAYEPPFHAAVAGSVWADALGQSGPGGQPSVSKYWRWLEAERLVKREQRTRTGIVGLLAEDGSGGPFSPPSPEGRFPFPYAYFTGNFHNRIGPAGKAVLLVALSQRGPFAPRGYGGEKRWYGLSRDTQRRGIRMLLALGLARVSSRYELLAGGIERQYVLQPPFAYSGPPNQGPRLRSD